MTWICQLGVLESVIGVQAGELSALSSVTVKLDAVRSTWAWRDISAFGWWSVRLQEQVLQKKVDMLL
jgi:hypothetical protein